VVHQAAGKTAVEHRGRTPKPSTSEHNVLVANLRVKEQEAFFGHRSALTALGDA
jgi:hypothetical protein